MSMLVLRKFLPYILIVVVAVGIYFYGYSKGVSVTEAAYQEVIMAERVRLMTANETALAEARSREVDLARGLNERDATIRQLAEEASTDTHAARPALSAGSVRRIDRIN